MKIYVAGGKNNVKSKFITGIREYACVDECILDNKVYCELAVLHKIWKSSNEDIVGLEHYRRFFANPYKLSNTSKQYVLNESTIHDILDYSDVILTSNPIKKDLLTYKYTEPHNPLIVSGPKIKDALRDWDNFLKKDGTLDMSKILSRQKKSYKYFSCNMVICKKDVLDRYCEWLFPKLELFAQTHKIPNRVYGYLSEYTMGEWMIENSYKIFDAPKIRFAKDLSKCDWTSSH